MTPNILITGAAGYIGGSLVTGLLQTYNNVVKKGQVFAAVKSDAQTKALSDLGVKVLQFDLLDEETVAESLACYEMQVDIVVHTASSLVPELAFTLIKALEKRKLATGQTTHFIHTSALSAFYVNTGWSKDVTDDSGPIFETEKQLADSFAIRKVKIPPLPERTDTDYPKTDVAVIEYAIAHGVVSYIVIPSTVYGRGSGHWNQLSVVIPGLVRASLHVKKVYKFAENITVSAVHITDLTALYMQIIKSILRKEDIPSGAEGYYFALAHRLNMWEFQRHLAAALGNRDIITNTSVEVFPNDDFAAEAIGVPSEFLEALWKSGDNFTAARPQAIGWQPKWDEKRFLNHVDDQISDVLQLGEARSSLIDSLFTAVGKSR